MTDFFVLLNDGTSYVLLNDGVSKVLLNQTSAVTAHGIWEGSLAPAEIVKPWKKEEEVEESSLELLIVSEPTMGQLFKKDLSGLPYLKQYRVQLYDILLNPIKQTFEEFKILHGVFKKTPFLNTSIDMRYESPSIITRPFKDQMFRKTLYGEKLHGINIINMVKELVGMQTLSFSFDFNDKELASAVTNKPPIGEPEEQERELEFSQPSSFIGTVIYSPDIQAMEIELNGSVYNYCGVPQRIYEQFESAGSKGEYYNREIKGIYTC